MAGESDDASLLREAMATEAVAQDSGDEATIDVAEERGITAEPNVEVDAGAEAQWQDPARQQGGDTGHRVPLGELLSERDKRHAIEREHSTLRQQFEQSQRALQEMQRQIHELRNPKQPVEKPDFYSDGERYVGQAISEAMTPLAREMFIQNLSIGKQFAVMQHGAETVDTAYAELDRLVNAGDPQALADFRKIESAPPIERFNMLVGLHRQREVMSKTGGDLGKYEQSLQERLLSDPAFLAKAVEAAQKQASTRPSPVVMPGAPTRRSAALPSVNQMGAASPNSRPDDINNDDRSLLSAAYRK